VVATFTGLSYAELSSRFPDAGAEYVYIENSFGKPLAWLTGWLILAGSVIGGATVALGFSRYFSTLFNTPVAWVALIMLTMIGVILIAGVQETASLTILFMAVEALGLVIIIIIGLPYIGSVDYLEMAHGMKGVIEAGVLIFFGYLRFEGITRLAEETENPEKNIPKAIIFSLVITTVFYILVGVAAVSVVPWQDLSTAKAPLSLVAEKVFGEHSFLILSVIALFSTFNTALVMLLSGSRLIYGITKRGALPQIFLKVQKRLRTPWIAITGVVVASMLFLSLSDLKTVANLTNFTIFVVFVVVNASVIYFRYKRPVEKGFRVPGTLGRFPVLPFLGIATSVFMIANLSTEVLLLGVGIIVIGGVVYFILHPPHRLWRPSTSMDKRRDKQ
jgi:APA family basic amino acid/polyamine antiporter